MSPAKLDTAPTSYIDEGDKTTLELNNLRKIVIRSKTGGRTLELELPDDTTIKGLSHVFFRGHIFIGVCQGGNEIQPNHKAVDISNVGEIRTIIGRNEGFSVINSEEKVVYEPTQTLITRSGIVLTAISVGQKVGFD